MERLERVAGAGITLNVSVYHVIQHYNVMPTDSSALCRGTYRRFSRNAQSLFSLCQVINCIGVLMWLCLLCLKKSAISPILCTNFCDLPPQLSTQENLPPSPVNRYYLPPSPVNRCYERTRVPLSHFVVCGIVNRFSQGFRFFSDSVWQYSGEQVQKGYNTCICFFWHVSLSLCWPIGTIFWPGSGPW